MGNAWTIIDGLQLQALQKRGQAVGKSLEKFRAGCIGAEVEAWQKA
jgi:hypothetical protein